MKMKENGRRRAQLDLRLAREGREGGRITFLILDVFPAVAVKTKIRQRDYTADRETGGGGRGRGQEIDQHSLNLRKITVITSHVFP